MKRMNAFKNRVAVHILALLLLAAGIILPPASAAYDGKYPYRVGATVGNPSLHIRPRFVTTINIFITN